MSFDERDRCVISSHIRFQLTDREGTLADNRIFHNFSRTIFSIKNVENWNSSSSETISKDKYVIVQVFI